jgi:WD40 repeat protein
VALSTARSVEVWDIDAPEDIDPRGHGRTVVSYGDLQASSARFSADGERLITGARGAPIDVWDTSTWEEIDSPLATDTPILAFSVDSRTERVCVSSDEGVVSVREVATGRAVGLPYWHPELNVGAFDPSGERFAVYSMELDRVLVWKVGDPVADVGALTDLRTREGHGSAVFSPDGTRAAIGEAGVVQVFDTSTWRPAMPPLPHQSTPFDMEFSADGRYLLSTSSFAGLAHLWDMQNGEELWTHRPFGRQINTVSIHADASLIAVASSDEGASVWDRATGKKTGGPVGTPSFWGIAFSPVEHVLAVCGGGGVELWDVDAWSKVGFLPTDGGSLPTAPLSQPTAGISP